MQNFLLNGDLYDSISIAEDDQWRRIRHILSPCFTSGRIKEVNFQSYRFLDGVTSTGYVFLIILHFGIFFLRCSTSWNIIPANWSPTYNPKRKMVTSSLWKGEYTMQ